LKQLPRLRQLRNGVISLWRSHPFFAKKGITLDRQVRQQARGRRGSEPRDERSECKPGRAQPVRNEASGMVLKNASAASLLIFPRRAPYLKTKDALSRDFKGGSLRSQCLLPARLVSYWLRPTGLAFAPLIPRLASPPISGGERPSAPETFQHS